MKNRISILPRQACAFGASSASGSSRIQLAPRVAILALAAMLIAFASPVFALDVPDMEGPVNDRAGVMSESERTELISYLSDVNAQTGVQIAVLTVKSLEGEAIESYSMKVAEKWKLGQADKNNGALLVVAIDDRALRIEVGYGLEPVLTDAKSGLIIRNKIVPWFKSGNYGEGIIDGAKTIAAVATGNAQSGSESGTGDGEAAARSVAATDDSFDVAGLVAAVFFIMLFFILRAGVASRFARRNAYRGSNGPGAFFWLFLLGLMSDSNRHNRHGGFGGGSGSGFSGGGFGGSGGGFSGGGGSFGGGGASGSW